MRHDFKTMPHGMPKEVLVQRHEGLIAELNEIDRKRQEREAKKAASIPATHQAAVAETAPETKLESAEKPYDPIAKYTDAVSIHTEGGNTWAVRKNRDQFLDAKLVASPFEGVEIGQVVLYPAGEAVWEAEPAPEEAPDAIIYDMPSRTPTPADVAIAAAGR